mmetsp:Transcript_9484/g.26602  ORF Transcript_9484/g.26602 Transcript_9484/m.26602 type:complete len:153 (-) Transcript_9484:1185-1643(-)
MELENGAMFASRVFSLISVAHDGVREAELQGILSLDNALLNDVYAWWIPPIARFPPLMITRLLGQIRFFLTQNGEGKWFHRQFREYCQERYVAVQGHSSRALLAQYFVATNSESFLLDHKVPVVCVLNALRIARCSYRGTGTPCRSTGLCTK